MASNSEKLSVRDIITHPLSVVSGVIATLSAFLSAPWLDALMATVWGQSGTLFTFFSVGASTIGPVLPFPVRWLEIAAIIAAVVFALKLADRVYDHYKSRL